MYPYRDYYPHAGLMLPNTNAVAGRVLVLPTGTAVEPQTTDKIFKIIYRAAIDVSDVRTALGKSRACC